MRNPRSAMASNRKKSPKKKRGGQVTHGMTNTRLFRIWRGMINRCKYKSLDRYEKYGGRGIKVCERWATSFENFMSDTAPYPGVPYQIDRIDNDGNYEPSNCRWVLPKDNCRNRSNAVSITWQGKTKPLMEWAEMAVVGNRTFRSRIRLGWDIQRALTEPLHDEFSNKKRVS
jgi:hypothetical protein